jgi:hypothetical protein
LSAVPKRSATRPDSISARFWRRAIASNVWEDRRPPPTRGEP